MIKIVLDDITKIAADAIVNAANERMLGGGGVDGAIHRAAGHELFEACLKVPEVRPGVRCPTGEARITPGFSLPAKFVIHTVGPRYRDGRHGEPELLANCYRNSLKLAAENGCKTIVFPSISTGAYHYPAEEAAPIAVREVQAFLADHPDMTVTFCLFNGSLDKTDMKALYERLVAEQTIAGRGNDILDESCFLADAAYVLFKVYRTKENFCGLLEALEEDLREDHTAYCPMTPEALDALANGEPQVWQVMHTSMGPLLALYTSNEQADRFHAGCNAVIKLHAFFNEVLGDSRLAGFILNPQDGANGVIIDRRMVELVALKAQQKSQRGQKTITVLATSDLHNTDIDTLLAHANKCDCMIIAGDVLPKGCQKDFSRAKRYLNGPFRTWCEKFQKPIFLIAGNHDIYLTDPHVSVDWPKNVTYLCDSSAHFGDFTFYGTPWCHWHGKNQKERTPGLFEVATNTLNEKFNMIPDGVDVLLIHENPKLHKEELESLGLKNFEKGNKPIRKALKERRPKLVLCGHNHRNDHKVFELFSGTHVASVSRCESKDRVKTQPALLVELRGDGTIVREEWVE